VASNAVLVTFVVLTLIFAGATAYLVAVPSGRTVTSTLISSTTIKGASQPPFAVGIAYKPGIGFYLVNGTGFTLYYRATDIPNSGKTTCVTSVCEKNWPVFFTSPLTLAPGLNSSDFAVITAYNNTQIITYKGYPLFYWAGDTKAGDTNGQGIGNFYVATVPSLVPPPASSTTTTTATTTGTTSYSYSYGY
jgi:predicted lipoprotein with Yx(FWY)xxD motif